MKPIRWILAAALVGALTLGLADAPAAAHPATRFHACAARSPQHTRCVGGGDEALEFSWGSTVHLRARILPPHPGPAQLWWVVPETHRWTRVTTVTVAADGRMRWSWVTDEGDAYPSTPYRFQFRVPGHDRSNVVRLYVTLGDA